MKHRLLFLPLCFFWLCCLPVAGQQQYDFRFRNDVKIVIDSDTVKNPWGGGLNSPVFSKIDLNNDATEDLFIYDRTLNKVFTYLARNVAGQWQWQYAPQYELLFPADLTDWVLLRDFNQDGRKDIFTKTSSGIKVYKNTAGANGLPVFALATDFIRFNNNINLQVSAENLPALADVDNDGDLDILTFDFAGSTTIEYYRNLRVEENLPADNLKFTLDTNWWGKLTKCQHVCNGYVFNASCRTTGTKHNDGMTLLALDLDNDGDQDILLGGDTCPDLARVTNTGTPANAALTAAGLQLNFPANSARASLNYFPAAYYEDLNFDNKKDLLVAPFVRSNTGDNVNFSQSAWLYGNTGSAEVPAFNLLQRDFLQADMVDVGEQAAPALADVDQDGDLDLLVGTRQGSVWFFRNVGTAAKAVFKRETTNYLNLAGAGFRNIKPQFADVNSDGRPDLVLAATTGTTGSINYILNTAAANQPFNFPVSSIRTLAVGRFAGDVPAFIDIDQDGDQDLIVASNVLASAASGALRFYRNTGSAANPVFTLENENFGNIPIELSRQNIYPLIVDLNKDKNPELLLADDKGEIRIYPNFRQNLTGTFTPVSDLFQNLITNEFVPARLGTGLALAAADLDGNGLPEIITGSRGGGMYFLGQQARGVLHSPGEPAEEEPLQLVVFPNPATRLVTIQSPEEITYSIFNLAGQRLTKELTLPAKKHEVDVSGLRPGMYIVRVQDRNNKVTGHKLLIQ